MRIVFFILLGLLTILFFFLVGIKFKVLALLKSDSKSVYYTLNHRFINLIQGKVLVLEQGGISVINKRSILMKKDSAPEFSKIMAMELLKNIKITRLDVYVDTGFVKDAFISALVYGGGLGFGGVVSALLNNKNIDTHFHFSNDTQVKDIAIALDLNIKVSALKIIIALIKSKLKFKKTKQEEKAYA